MMTHRGATAALALTLALVGGSGALATVGGSGRQAAIDGLANRLGQTVADTPEGAHEDFYEGQLVAAIDQAQVECAIAIAAVQEARGRPAPTAAHQALLVLSRRVGRCGGGTGALGGGLTAGGNGPAAGGGGTAGSNYR